MKWLGRLWRFFQAELLVLASAAFNRRTPLKLRALLGLALLYFISPVDIIPDAIPLAGILDDAIVVPALLAAVLNQLPPGVRAESEAHASGIERKMPWILLAVSAVLLLWMGLFLWAAYSFIMWLAH